MPDSAEAGARAVKRVLAGARSSQGGPAPLSTLLAMASVTTRDVSVVSRAHALRPEVERSTGARYRESVAEVGKKHLARDLEASREANRESAR